MTLLVTVFAAITATIVWYIHAPEDKLKLGMLCTMFWGASMMWFVDACFEYAELGMKYFCPSAADFLNDLVLGFSVIALAMIIWLVRLMVADPEGKVREAFRRKCKEDNAVNSMKH